MRVIIYSKRLSILLFKVKNKQYTYRCMFTSKQHVSTIENFDRFLPTWCRTTIIRQNKIFPKVIRLTLIDWLMEVPSIKTDPIENIQAVWKEKLSFFLLRNFMQANYILRFFSLLYVWDIYNQNVVDFDSPKYQCMTDLSYLFIFANRNSVNASFGRFVLQQY